jgi:hypothetical protein
MKIKTLAEFTPELWEKLFGAFIIANKSHWRGAPFDAVHNLLKTKGRFEFAVTGMGTWTSRFVIVVLPDDQLDVEFVANSELSPLMQQHLAKMKETFERELRKLL